MATEGWVDVSDPGVMFDTPEGSSPHQGSQLLQSRSGSGQKECKVKGSEGR